MPPCRDLVLSEEYNPETEWLERLQSLEIEARDVARRREQSACAEDRDTLQRQLQELERQIDAIKAKLKR